MMLCGGKPPPAGCHISRWRSAPGLKANCTALLRGFHPLITTSTVRWVRCRALQPGDQPTEPASSNPDRGTDGRRKNWDDDEGWQPGSSSDRSSRGGSRGRGTRYTSSTSTPPTTGTPAQRTGSPRHSDGHTSRREQQAPEAKRRPWRSHSAPPAPNRGNGLNPSGASPTRRRKATLDPIVQQAIKADLPRVVQQIGAYRQLVEQNNKRGQQPATFSADIINLCVSLSGSITRDSRDARERRRLSLQQDSQLQEDAKQAAEWLLAQTVVLLRDSHTKALSTRSADGCLPLLDLCAFAFTLHDLEEVVGNQGAIRRLAQATAKHATLRLQLGDMPPSMQAWKDLLYGLTMAGLVVSTDRAAGRVEAESIHLKQLLDAGAQHLPAVLRSQAAEARNVSLTLLAYAYAGYTGDLGPVIQALASNLEGCLQDAIPQALSNIVWALGKLSESWRHGTYPTHVHFVFSWALGQLGEHVQQRQHQTGSQEFSNAVYGCALAGHMKGLPQFLALVCQHCGEVMDRTAPQAWANTIWGVATLYEATFEEGNTQEAKQLLQYGQILLARCVQKPDAMGGATPQNWSNTVWAAAKLGCVQEGAQLLGQLTSKFDVMQSANLQAWSNMVWAVATLYEAAVGEGSARLARELQQYGNVLLGRCLHRPDSFKGAVPQDWSNTLLAAAKLGCVEEGAQLLRQLTRNLHLMVGATPQAWSNTIWAAATLRLYNQGLFKRAMQELSAMPSAAMKPQQLSNALWACAICAHWDSGVQQLLGRLRDFDLVQFNGQDLANTAWAWAVLVCLAQEDGSYGQHAQCFQQVAAALFKEAASRPVSSLTAEGRRQLYQAHLFAGYLGIPGLPAWQVLEAATQAGLTVHITTSRRQQNVSSALKQMGYTTQLEGLSPDSLMGADIAITALPDGSPCSIAVEFDGPSHYIAELTASGASVDRLEGPTRLRNSLLSRSFPDGVVCIYWKDWVAIDGDKRSQEEYLSKALAKVVRDKEQPVSRTGTATLKMAPASTASGSGSHTTSAKSVRVRKSPAGGGKSDSKSQVMGGNQPPAEAISTISRAVKRRRSSKQQSLGQDEE